jgi:hypothetical protein
LHFHLTPRHHHITTHHSLLRYSKFQNESPT